MRVSRSKPNRACSADAAKYESPHQPNFVASGKKFSTPERNSGSDGESEVTDNEFSSINKDEGKLGVYRPEFARIAKAMCAMGATTYVLADAFDVTTDTISAWQHTHEDFCEACKVGKESADDRVERSLYERAVGYEYEAEIVMQYQGRPIVGKYRKHVPADPTSGMFWLVNRRPNEWSYKPRPKSDPKPEGELAILLREIEGTRLLPKNMTPNDIAPPLHHDST